MNSHNKCCFKCCSPDQLISELDIKLLYEAVTLLREIPWFFEMTKVLHKLRDLAAERRNGSGEENGAKTLRKCQNGWSPKLGTIRLRNQVVSLLAIPQYRVRRLCVEGKSGRNISDFELGLSEARFD